MATFEAKPRWFPKIRGPYVAYLRSSPRPNSRLDLNAQRKAIDALLSKGRATQVEGDFVEIEPLTQGARPALERAIASAEKHNATLIIGKFSRMRGGSRWLALIMDLRISVRAADLPQSTYAEFSRFLLDDRNRRSRIGEKIKEALAATKARGVRLGGRRENSSGLKLGPDRSAKSRSERAHWRGQQSVSEIEAIKKRGTSSLTGIAAQLNQMGHKAPRGGKWSAAQVRRVIQNFEKE